MKKIKRILAMSAVILLLGLYLVTFFAAIFVTPASVTMFKTCIIATIMVPIMMYVIFFIYRLIYPEKEEKKEQAGSRSGERAGMTEEAGEQEQLTGKEEERN